jgi:hypothetical protein
VKELNLPAYSFRQKDEEDGKRLIFDEFRKKWLVLTPEEWVRQHFVKYLVTEKGYPLGLIGIEVTFKMNSLTRRADVLVYNRVGNPVLIVECKAPDVRINNSVFDQIVEYNFKFKLKYLVVTNGIKHYACSLGGEDVPEYEFLDSIPDYDQIQ